MEPKSIHSSDSDNLDPELLDRYWLGETTPIESETVDGWFAANPLWKERYNQLHKHLQSDTRSRWEPLTPIEVHNSIDKVLMETGIKARPGVKTGIGFGTNPDSKIRSNVNDSGLSGSHAIHGINAPQMNKVKGQVFPRSFVALGVAFVCTLVVGLGWFFSNTSSKEQIGQTYTTGIGQRITFTLSDGSRITLGPQSVMNVPTQFGSSTRTVALNGEAYFDVTSTDRIPFIVKTGNTQTRVLGTRFVVKYYDDRFGARIAVESGRVSFGKYSEAGDSRNADVAVNSTNNDVIVTPGLVAFADSAGLNISLSKEETLSDYTDWVHSRLTFRSTPVSEALKTLTRWYGVQFSVSDPELLGSSITGSLPYGSVEDMLTTLRDLLDVSQSYERSEDGTIKVTLRPNQ